MTTAPTTADPAEKFQRTVADLDAEAEAINAKLEAARDEKVEIENRVRTLETQFNRVCWKMEDLIQGEKRRAQNERNA